MEPGSSLVAESTHRLFSDMMSPELLAKAAGGHVPTDCWAAIEEQGLPLALLTEGQGGFGLGLTDVAQIMRLQGMFGVPLPLGETIVANHCLALAEMPLAVGMASLATGEAKDRIALSRKGGVWRLQGIAHRVPWGRCSTIVLATLDDQARPRLAVLGPGRGSVAEGANLAMEPRDTVTFDVELPATAVAALPDSLDLGGVRAAGAAVRCLAIAGAAERVLAMTVAYANERTQFGKSIGKFQAIQQALAVMAEEVAACGAAADMAAEAIGGDWLPVAAAKVRCGEAAGVIAATAHQVHGAIGFSREHVLHHFTKRLWSWRDEFGAEAEWALRIGRRVASQGADQLWPLVTAP